MSQSTRVRHILTEIKGLDYDARLYLAEQLMKLLRSSKSKAVSAPQSLSDLTGLGANIWRNVDAEEYVRDERAWER